MSVTSRWRNSLGDLLSSASDIFEASIIHHGKAVSQVIGSYCSSINFDNKRYWDVRQEFEMKMYEPKQLKSSSVFREDAVLLGKGEVDKAQEAKESLEVIQRNDRNLRKKINK